MKKRMVGTIPDHVTTTAIRKWGRRTQKGPPGFVHSGVGSPARVSEDGG